MFLIQSNKSRGLVTALTQLLLDGFNQTNVYGSGLIAARGRGSQLQAQEPASEDPAQQLERGVVGSFSAQRQQA